MTRKRRQTLPVPDQPSSTYERMVAEGLITPATRDLLDVQPLPAVKGKQVSQVLLEMREDTESPA